MNGRSSDLSPLPIAFPRILILSDFVLGNAVMRNTAAGLFGILTRFPFKQQTAERGVLHQFADKVKSFFFNYKFLRRFFFIPENCCREYLDVIAKRCTFTLNNYRIAYL